jgi:hypothetical protein
VDEKRASGGETLWIDHPVTNRERLWGGLLALDMERSDELALWCPAQAALLFGDVMLRNHAGDLHVCPDSWQQPDGGPARLRTVLSSLTDLPVEHVFVSHGPLVLGGGSESLRAAIR